MAKKPRARQPRAPAATDVSADADFVKVVRWIYSSGVLYSRDGVTINAKPIRELALLSHADQIQALHVGIGLIAMGRAIDMLPPYEGKAYAHDLLGALVERTNSSASRFIYSIHLTHRGNPPANFEARWDRAKFAGVVLALQEAANRDGDKLSRKKAVELAKAKCRQSSYRLYTDQAVKGWIARGEVPDADDYCGLIIQKAESLGGDRSLTSRVIDVARQPIILFRLSDWPGL